MAVGVAKIVDGLTIPSFTKSEEFVWEEAVLSHDHEVGIETGKSLDHSDLTVGHGDKPIVGVGRLVIIDVRYIQIYNLMN